MVKKHVQCKWVLGAPNVPISGLLQGIVGKILVFNCKSPGYIAPLMPNWFLDYPRLRSRNHTYVVIELAKQIILQGGQM